MNVSVRLYGWLLIAYPREFRRVFGDQMVQVFPRLLSRRSTQRLSAELLVENARRPCMHGGKRT